MLIYYSVYTDTSTPHAYCFNLRKVYTPSLVNKEGTTYPDESPH
jgi:hypothetical protein